MYMQIYMYIERERERERERSITMAMLLKALLQTTSSTLLFETPMTASMVQCRDHSGL